MKVMSVVNLSRGSQPIARVEVASTPWDRLRGLLGREGLAPRAGLWITPCAGVHTMFMRFAIDVVALDRQQRVVRVWRKLAPWRATRVSFRVSSVLEFRAGDAQLCGIETGDQLRLLEA